MKLTVVIPIYKAEKFLQRCIESIINQKANFAYEILLIDDGSPDSSGRICDQYSSIYKFIHTLHLANQGVGHARNTGIEHSHGEYIMFIDSDDFLEPDLFHKFENIFNQYNSECYIYGYKSYPNDLPNDRHYLQDRFYTNQEDIANLYIDLKKNYLLFSPINKFYKADIIRKYNIRFRENIHYYEDYLFNLDFFCHCKTIYTIGETFYNYVQHEGERLDSKYTPADTRINVAKEILTKSNLLPSNPSSQKYNILEYYNYLLNCIDSEILYKQKRRKILQYINYLLTQIKRYGYYKDFKKFIGPRKYIFLINNIFIIYCMLIIRKTIINIIRR